MYSIHLKILVRKWICFPGHQRVEMTSGPYSQQVHSPGWSRVPFPHFPSNRDHFIIFIIFYFSSYFAHFLPRFDPPGGRVAQPGRPWQRDCLIYAYRAGVIRLLLILGTSSGRNHSFHIKYD